MLAGSGHVRQEEKQDLGMRGLDGPGRRGQKGCHAAARACSAWEHGRDDAHDVTCFWFHLIVFDWDYLQDFELKCTKS
jgi:hypothetical protein